MILLFRNLSLDLVPRLNGEQVDAEKISIVQLYQIHKESETRMTDNKVRHLENLLNSFIYCRLKFSRKYNKEENCQVEIFA